MNFRIYFGRGFALSMPDSSSGALLGTNIYLTGDII